MDRAELAALDAGRGAVALGGFRALAVRGADAERFLQDLLTADVGVLRPGEATPSLLLGPTGRIRAELHVLRREGGYLVLQRRDQPRPIGELLGPYVLSSDVLLEETPPPPLLGVPSPRRWRFVAPGEPDLVPVSPAALEAWRIRSGIPRFPVDLDEDSLPAEGGLDDGVTIAPDKGCYLGQESVARVRRGHPTRVVLALRAARPVEPGSPVEAGGETVGVVTSADVEGGDDVALLVRVRWGARAAELSAGDVLLRRP